MVATSIVYLSQRRSYKSIFWYEVGCAGIAWFILAAFVKIDSAKSDLTVDEKIESAGEIEERRLGRREEAFISP